MALNGTGLAAVTWPGNIRLYFQDTDGWIRESGYQYVWSGGSSLDRKFQAPLGTPLAATTADNGSTIHVAYRNSNNILADYVYVSTPTPSWVPGTLSTLKISLNSSLKFDICSWKSSNRTRLRVYYQDSGKNNIQEVCNDNGTWTQGSTLGNALAGSHVTAFAINDSNLRVYFQNSDQFIVEQPFINGWKDPAQIGRAPALTALAAVSMLVSGASQIVLCYRESDNTIYAAQFNNGWKITPTKASCMQGSRIALAAFDSQLSSIRAYYQKPDAGFTLQELCYNTPWTSGVSIPIGTKVFPPIISYSDWMNQSLSWMGNATFKQLCLPGSHDAGMSVANNLTAYCGKDSVLTQTTNIGQQLAVGIRYFDLRPVLGPNNLFVMGHYSDVLPWNDNKILDTLLLYYKIGQFSNTWQGGNGESLSDIITEVNKFTQTHRELIVLNLSHMFHVPDASKNFGKLQGINQADYMVLQRQLSALQHVLTQDMVDKKGKGEIVNWNLSDFIADGPCVVVVFDDGKPGWWPSNSNWPMSTASSGTSGPYYAPAQSIGLNAFNGVHPTTSPPYGFAANDSQALGVISLDQSQTPFQSVVSYLYDSGQLTKASVTAFLVALGWVIGPLNIPEYVTSALTNPASVNTLQLSANNKASITPYFPNAIQWNQTVWPNKISGDQCDGIDMAQWCIKVNQARFKYT